MRTYRPNYKHVLGIKRGRIFGTHGWRTVWSRFVVLGKGDRNDLGRKEEEKENMKRNRTSVHGHVGIESADRDTKTFRPLK